jgi:hypothetical protein
MTTAQHDSTNTKKGPSTTRAPLAEAAGRESGQRRLETLTWCALAGLALSLLYVQALITRSLEPVPTANVLVLLLIAVAGVRGWRPALPLGVAWMGLMLVASFSVILRRFGQPESLHLWVWNAATLAVIVGGLGCGVAALLQRRKARRQGAGRIGPSTRTSR